MTQATQETTRHRTWLHWRQHGNKDNNGKRTIAKTPM